MPEENKKNTSLHRRKALEPFWVQALLSEWPEEGANTFIQWEFALTKGYKEKYSL